MLYAAALIPIGLLADRVNRPRLLAGGLVFWSLLTMTGSKVTHSDNRKRQWVSQYAHITPSLSEHGVTRTCCAQWLKIMLLLQCYQPGCLRTGLRAHAFLPVKACPQDIRDIILGHCSTTELATPCTAVVAMLCLCMWFDLTAACCNGIGKQLPAAAGNQGGLCGSTGHPEPRLLQLDSRAVPSEQNHSHGFLQQCHLHGPGSVLCCCHCGRPAGHQALLPGRPNGQPT